MSTSTLRVAGLLVSGVVIFGTGIMLTRAGRPYGTAVLTVHKLVDLAAVVVIGVMVYRANRAVPLSAVEWAIVLAAALLTIATFATGGLVSASENPPEWAVRLHRIAPWVAGLLAAASAYIAVAHS